MNAASLSNPIPQTPLTGLVPAALASVLLTATPARSRIRRYSQVSRSLKPRRAAVADVVIGDVLPYYTREEQYGWIQQMDRVWVEVYNNGSADSGPFTVEFQWNHNGTCERQSNCYADGLRAGQSMWVVFQAVGSSEEFDYNLFAPDAHFKLSVNSFDPIKQRYTTTNVFRTPARP